MISKTLKVLEEAANRATGEVGVALYDVEEKKTSHGVVALIYITKIGGVSVQECTAVSRLIGSELELLDVYRDKYTLEVSSPGLERELKYKKHYAGAINNKIKVRFIENKKDDKNKKSTEVIGILKEVTPNAIKIGKHDNEELVVPFTSIKKAKTLFDYSDEKRGKDGK